MVIITTMTEERQFTTFDIMRALKIPRDDLQNWVKGGFIKPTVPSPGRGIPAKFTRSDIYGLALFIELLSHGLSRDQACFLANKYHASIRSSCVDDGFTYVEVKEPIDFIIFRYIVDEKGEKVIAPEILTSQDSQDQVVSLHSGRTVPAWDKKRYHGQGQIAEWDSLLVINYKKIRLKIDLALPEQLNHEAEK